MVKSASHLFCTAFKCHYGWLWFYTWNISYRINYMISWQTSKTILWGKPMVDRVRFLIYCTVRSWRNQFAHTVELVLDLGQKYYTQDASQQKNIHSQYYFGKRLGPICLVDIEHGLDRQLNFAGFTNDSYYIATCGKYIFLATTASTRPKLCLPPTTIQIVQGKRIKSEQQHTQTHIRTRSVSK